MDGWVCNYICVYTCVCMDVCVSMWYLFICMCVCIPDSNTTHTPKHLENSDLRWLCTTVGRGRVDLPSLGA